MIGHIKLHRKFLEWEWYSDINVRLVFLHFMVKANWKDSNFKGVTIKRGELIIGHKETPKEIGVTIQQFRTVIKKLKSTHEITTKSTNKHTVVTLINYNEHQDTESKPTSKSTSNITNQQHSNNKQVTTSKEDNNIIREEDKNKSIKNTLLSEIEISDLEDNLKDYFTIAKSFQELFIKNLKEKNSPCVNQEKAKFGNYVDPIRLMMTTDKITLSQVQGVYKYLDSPKGDFWKSNILSTSKLRKQFQQLSLKANTENGKQGQNTGFSRTGTKTSATYSRSEAVGSAPTPTDGSDRATEN